MPKSLIASFRENFKRTNRANSGGLQRRWFNDRRFWTTRNLIFEHDARPGTTKISLFEEILSTGGTLEVIDLIWDVFELWRKERILTAVSSELLWD